MVSAMSSDETSESEMSKGISIGNVDKILKSIRDKYFDKDTPSGAAELVGMHDAIAMIFKRECMNFTEHYFEQFGVVLPKVVSKDGKPITAEGTFLYHDINGDLQTARYTESPGSLVVVAPTEIKLEPDDIMGWSSNLEHGNYHKDYKFLEASREGEGHDWLMLFKELV